MGKIVGRQIVRNLMPHRCSDWHGLIESSEAREKNFDVSDFNSHWWKTLSGICPAVVEWKLHDSSREETMVLALLQP